ncbi:hypothetical protein BZA05DRAFT_263623 [Tricharina praecox]|uniref:uncharacterized protein n=1 Tax=Tricharina praecox TaxID=43433 RepID=UPI002220472F|nr:uncharacterized protein BZA05DRAFT_263623 [Tricharina praecox]KAI5854356.1 hypothetical protein BZA05DRAFT_263623 [Tricharina praecox]
MCYPANSSIPDISGTRQQILANCKILYPDKEVVIAIRRETDSSEAMAFVMDAANPASMYWEDFLVSVTISSKYAIEHLLALMHQTEALLEDKSRQDLCIAIGIDQEVTSEYDRLMGLDEEFEGEYPRYTEVIEDDEVEDEVYAQLRKRAVAKMLKKKSEHRKQIQEEAKELIQRKEDEYANYQPTETTSDDNTAHSDQSSPPANSDEGTYGEDEAVTLAAATESENITGPLQHPPDNGSTSEQQQLTTPEELLVSAAIGPYAAKLLRGIEVIKKLRAENSECSAERSTLMAEVESLKRDATEQHTQHQAVEAELSELKAALRERDNGAEQERELECESWARAVSQLQTRNDRLTEALSSANTRASVARVRQTQLETELISWQRYFETRSLRFDISEPERAQCASAVDTIQKVLWPKIEAFQSSASSFTDGAHTPSTVTDWL